jgi:hypothetical protein
MKRHHHLQSIEHSVAGMGFNAQKPQRAASGVLRLWFAAVRLRRVLTKSK